MPSGRKSNISLNCHGPGSGKFVDRIVGILQVVQGAGESLGLSAIARRAGIPKSSAHRLLAKLVESNALQRHGDQYTLGSAMWRPMEDSHSNIEFLRRTFKPVLVQLHCRTGYIVELGIPDDLTVRFIDAAYDETYISIIGQLERNSLLLDSAAGKVLLAHDRNLANRLIYRHGNASPILDADVLPAVLEKELSEIRNRGISTTSTPVGGGITAAAIPVFDVERRPVAALSLGAHSDRFQTGLAHAMLRRVSDHVSLLTKHYAVRTCKRTNMPNGGSVPRTW